MHFGLDMLFVLGFLNRTWINLLFLSAGKQQDSNDAYLEHTVELCIMYFIFGKTFNIFIGIIIQSIYFY